MSKIDMMKSMTQDANNTEYKDEQTRMEARLMVLSLQEESRIKNSQEMIQLMKKLQSSISQSAGQVESAARLVKSNNFELTKYYDKEIDLVNARIVELQELTQRISDTTLSLLETGAGIRMLLAITAIVLTLTVAVVFLISKRGHWI